MVKSFKFLGYRIDNKIFYSLEHKYILPIDGITPQISLRKTKSELLEYLLKNGRKRVVTDNELMTHVWDNNGLRSSSQRLWQVVKSVKLMLTELGVSTDIIIRVGANGYIINDAMVAEIFESEDKESSLNVAKMILLTQEKIKPTSQIV